jgi:antitoxin (DNA-binding transcriptional repressor) of toxin-antitoxin stability system
MVSMRAVGLKMLKNKLSEYVRLVQGGETILVTDRDRVVAELVPPQAGRSPAVADAVLAELVRQGWFSPAARPLTGPPPRAPVVAFEELMREFDEARADR